MTRAWITVDEDGRLVFPQASEAKSGGAWARVSRPGCCTQQPSTATRRAGWDSSVAKFAPTPIPGPKCRPAISPLRRSRSWAAWVRPCGSLAGEKALDAMLQSLNAFVFADPTFSEARDRQKDYSRG